MLTGKVLRFDDVRGYGFVAPDEGNEDVFIHVNDLECDKRLIVPGVRVRFAAEEGDRGLKASRVSLVEHRADQPPTDGQPTVAAYDDMACDVLTARELRDELTEAMLAGAPSLTGQQILAVRQSVLELARKHCWIDE
ncbi:cold shock domain-containing protein [Amycolatopsis mongoliensis]|uniref:Cold shock domain-containing protein n=1 Tax=Amycolatopsis mongoliensis TaxID=715475 RepID=A0A9Y2NE13_9PSEU|nr:cold shock domain-containing protein [Amycolatopsis sp. 4-36]WIX98213.1 cold shock domain-containing protein [Amycolatopsis sp. 4-36]